MKLPKRQKSEIFNMRMDPSTKKKLEELSKGKGFKNNSSAVIRYLIESAHSKRM